jgi:hypothetical protein
VVAETQRRRGIEVLKFLDSSRPSVETIAPSNHLNHRRKERPKAVDNGHVLLPFNSLVEWISLNMKYRYCRVLTETSSISKTTFGIATELHHNCPSPQCIARKLDRENDTMKALKVDDDSEDNKMGDPADKNAKRCQTLAKHRNSRFAVNWGLVAGNQLFGESQKAGKIVAGFLDLAPHAFPKNWWWMEDQLAVQHAKVASEIIDANLKDAVKDKPSYPKNGKVPPLTVSFDMGWQKRGRSYNSLSGHAFLIDAHSGKIVAMQVHSKSCLKCSRAVKKGIAEENVPEHKCPKNYDGSSKGMEATAALEMVKRLCKHEEVQVYVKEMVLNDDASTRALLTHCLKELADFVLGFEWPKDSAGKRNMKQVGKLPVDHPVIFFLADLMHRIRCFNKHVFGLALAPQSTSTCTMVDAYRLKRNFGYWILSYHTMTFDIFREKSKAVVEHHFNNHTHCGDWCAMKNADATKAAIGELKCRCKKENKKMHGDISQIMDRFTETEKLKECHHECSSQKNESMNRMISRYVKKDRTFCQSMPLHSRTCMAVGIDSVGHEEHYERLFAGIRIPFPNASTRMMVRAMEKRQDYDRKYQAQISRRRIRSIKRFASTKSEFRKEMAEKALGLSYASGMNMEVEPGTFSS